MNRLEIISLLVVLAIVGIIFIKSKRFDAFLTWLLTGSKPTTVADLKKGVESLDKTKEVVKKNLDKQEADVKKAKEQLETL